MIVLDTHVWVWFTADNRLLSDAALDAIRGRLGLRALGRLRHLDYAAVPT